MESEYKRKRKKTKTKLEIVSNRFELNERKRETQTSKVHKLKSTQNYFN